MKLLPKFLFASLLVALVPLGIAGWLVSRSSENSLRAAGERLQQGLADRAAEALSGQLDEAVARLAVLQRALDLARGAPGSGDRLESLMSSFPAYQDLWVYNSEGQKKFSVHRFGESRGVNPNEWTGIRAGLEARGFHVGSAVIGPGGSPLVLVTVPLTRESGETAGFLSARLSLYFLGDVLRALDLGFNGRAFLIDERGRLLADSLSSKSPRPSVVPGPWLARDFRTGEYDSFDGVRVLGARAPINERDWAVVFEQPASTALAAVARLRRQILVALAGAALFAAALALALGGFVTRPLRVFHSIVKKMKAGEFDALIPFRSKDEIGSIAQALREAQPVLEKKGRDSMLGQMARLIGHDLRTPLQGLRNNLDILLENASDSPLVEKHFRLSYETLDWMNDFVEDILTVGRDRPLQRQTTNINVLLRDLMEKIKTPPGINIQWNLAVNLPPCPLDPKEARKALSNALKNAVEALGDKGEIELTTREGIDTTIVTVSDNGPGIPEEKKARLFEEFTTKDTGTGLGLLVMKKVVERHGGTLEIDSTPGRGTSVTFRFPGSVRQ